MEPRPTTPADDLYAGTAPHEEQSSGEDWGSRYGAAPPPPPPPGSSPDFSGFFLLLDGLRRAAPAELQAGLKSFIREGLLTLRSLIDWYLDRLDRPTREPAVEEIPIDP
ncbi:MAG: hypothetical protein M3131_08035 [Actinomycetota bacterium]|nr:hypothetical protein [Actinomycetota bacterium]